MLPSVILIYYLRYVIVSFFLLLSIIIIKIQSFNSNREKIGIKKIWNCHLIYNYYPFAFLVDIIKQFEATWNHRYQSCLYYLVVILFCEFLLFLVFSMFCWLFGTFWMFEWQNNRNQLKHFWSFNVAFTISFRFLLWPF